MTDELDEIDESELHAALQADQADDGGRPYYHPPAGRASALELTALGLVAWLLLRAH